jgi:hypothetical protein
METPFRMPYKQKGAGFTRRVEEEMQVLGN